MQLWRAINHWAEVLPKKKALTPLTYRELRSSILHAMKLLPDLLNKRVGIIIPNRPLWAIYDIALTLKGAIVVPIPDFFSPGQVRHIIQDANIDMVIVDPDHLYRLTGFDSITCTVDVIIAEPSLESPGEKDIIQTEPEKELPMDRVVKIVYTSGTTGRPKGVLITLRSIETVITSLYWRTKASTDDIHLSLLPLSTLLEAIGGLYLPLVAGATVTYPCVGSRRLDIDSSGIQKLFRKVRPTTLILVPLLLETILQAVGEKREGFQSLRFVACGGAPLSSELLDRAIKMGIPLYQGYGLSECTSVVSLNGEGKNRLRSVGKPLSHLRVEINRDGEVTVLGKAMMAGYVGDSKDELSVWATGDIGYTDDDGYLYITGRKDNMFVTGYGRNISPEWIEAEIALSKAVRQVLVYGEGKPYLSALVIPDLAWLSKIAKRLGIGGGSCELIHHPAVERTMLEEIGRTTSNLPEYGRVKSVAMIDESSVRNRGLLTPEGRLRRKEVLKTYGRELEALYEKDLSLHKTHESRREKREISQGVDGWYT